MTIHSQPRSHACHVCGRTFNTSFAMSRHSRLHQLHVTSLSSSAIPAAAAGVTTLDNITAGSGNADVVHHGIMPL